MLGKSLDSPCEEKSNQMCLAFRRFNFRCPNGMGSLVTGWKYCAVRDDATRLHPDFVDWEQLDEATQDYDRKTAQNPADILATVGYCIGELKE